MARTVDSVVKEVLANQMVEIIQLTVRNEELQEEVKALKVLILELEGGATKSAS